MTKRGKTAKLRTHKNNLELLLDHLGVKRSSLRVLWSVNIKTVNIKVRNPGKLLYNEIESLSALLQLPMVSLIYIIGQFKTFQTFNDWNDDQFNKLVINFELLYSHNTTLVLIDNKGRQIDLKAMYLDIHDKYINKVKNTLEFNVNRLSSINKHVSNYIADIDNKVIFKQSDNIPGSGFPTGPQIDK